MTQFFCGLAIVVIVGVISFDAGVASGAKKGHREYHRGEIACQPMLSGELECIKKAKP